MCRNGLRLERNNAGFEVSLVDAQVNLVLLDFRLGIHALDLHNESLKIAIGTSFSFRQPGAPATTLEPEEANPALGALAVTLRHQQVRRCVVKTGGDLELEFGSGLMIEVPPDPHYEAWQLDLPGHKIIAMPGGELAVWDETS
jgi:hypothetical protein